MKDRALFAKTVAASAACLLHGAAILAVTQRAEVEIEGRAGAAETSLGASFADLAAGTLSADGPQEMKDPAEPEVTPADEPAAAALPPDATAAAMRPDTPDAAPPEMPARRAARETPEETPPARAVAPDVAGMPETAPDTPSEIPATAPETARPSNPGQAAVIPPAEPVEASPETASPDPVRQTEAAEVVAASNAPPAAVTRSLRPRHRSPAFETAHKAPPQPTAPPQPVQATPRPQGNADRTARAGAATGAEEARTRQAAAGPGRSSEAGNAAASNYPGQVMRKISRVPRPRVGARGTAVVAFTIASGGGLAGLSLARSSGNGRLDQAALTVIRRAAPFPPPPAGARRSFSIRIKGG